MFPQRENYEHQFQLFLLQTGNGLPPLIKLLLLNWMNSQQSVFQWKRYHTRQRRSNRHSQLYYSRQAFTLPVPANLLMVSVKDSHGMMMIESCKQSIPFPQPATTLWTNTEYYLTGSIEMLQEQFIQGGLALFATDL